MAFLQISMFIAAVLGAMATGSALDQGFPVEMAIVRGALVFVAVSFVGYGGELIVVTAPRRMRAQAKQAPPPVATSSEPQPSPLPQLMAPAQSVSNDVNNNDADAGLRPAA